MTSFSPHSELRRCHSNRDSFIPTATVLESAKQVLRKQGRRFGKKVFLEQERVSLKNPARVLRDSADTHDPTTNQWEPKNKIEKRVIESINARKAKIEAGQKFDRELKASSRRRKPIPRKRTVTEASRLEFERSISDRVFQAMSPHVVEKVPKPKRSHFIWTFDYQATHRKRSKRRIHALISPPASNSPLRLSAAPSDVTKNPLSAINTVINQCDDHLNDAETANMRNIQSFKLRMFRSYQALKNVVDPELRPFNPFTKHYRRANVRKFKEKGAFIYGAKSIPCYLSSRRFIDPQELYN